ncbi:MAG: hypothetical protein R3D99_00005, partial [Altererythrobacter sp.]
MKDDYLEYGFLVRGIIPIVTEKELGNPEFIRRVRTYASMLGIPWRRWHTFLTDLYRDAPFIFVKDQCQEVYLNMDVFETESIDYWFRDF